MISNFEVGYGLEKCVLPLSDMRSLDFAVNHFVMKLLGQTMNVIQGCRDYLKFRLPKVILVERRKTFLFNYANI